MKKFEYTTKEDNFCSPSIMLLNDMGGEGWELVNIKEEKKDECYIIRTYLFKREIDTENEK